MKPMHDDWPLYFNEMLHVKNKENHIGIVTLWSKKEIYIERLHEVDYNSIGQLYSREEGLSSLVRNLLSNKNITDLVMVGTDLNNCSDALISLFENGVESENVVICDKYSKIDDEVSKDAIERLRENVTLHNLRDIKDKEGLIKALDEIKKRGPYGDFETFKEPELKSPDRFPSDNSVYKVRGKTIYDTWVKILSIINNFGEIKESQYGDPQKEVISLVSVVTDEDPDNPNLNEDFGFTREELERYIPQVTTPSNVEGLDYTYGQRLMNFRNIDQIKNIVEQLKKENYTRRAVACTWDIMKDYNNPKAPCLDLVQALVQDNKLYLTCFFRSNDMFEAWPRNAFALRKLQKNICEEVGVEMGNLVIISNSAHYYERSFNKVTEILKKSENRLIWDPDPYGTIIVTIDKDKIYAQHIDTNGKKLEVVEGKTAMEVYRKIAKSMKISDISHAMDIGCELQKAEHAIKLGVMYSQDKEINLNKEN